MAARLGSGLAALPGARLLHPVEGNEVFVELGDRAIERLAAAGFGFYRWGEAPIIRLVTAFDTASEAVESFLRVAARGAWQCHEALSDARACRAEHRLPLCGKKNCPPTNFFLHRRVMRLFIDLADALARAYGPSWLCNDVTRPFWKSRSSWAGPERELDMVAILRRAATPCPDVDHQDHGVACGFEAAVTPKSEQ